jgi:ketosteroid isomerase-like protein
MVLTQEVAMSERERGTESRSGTERSVPLTTTAEKRGTTENVEARNRELMQTLDDAWNSQDMETFAKRHKQDVVVRWPGKGPTNGVHDHTAEALEFFKTFPDQRVHNRPYKMLIASGDWTCSIANFTGTMKGPMKGPDGKEIPPTGKSFEVDFCTVARWDNNGQIIEENLFYDLVTFMKQIGLGQ